MIKPVYLVLTYSHDRASDEIGHRLAISGFYWLEDEKQLPDTQPFRGASWRFHLDEKENMYPNKARWDGLVAYAKKHPSHDD